MTRADLISLIAPEDREGAMSLTTEELQALYDREAGPFAPKTTREFGHSVFRPPTQRRS